MFKHFLFENRAILDVMCKRVLQPDTEHIKT